MFSLSGTPGSTPVVNVPTGTPPDTRLVPATNPRGSSSTGMGSNGTIAALQIVPFETNLKLTREREQWLVDRAVERIKEVAREMGLLDNGRVRHGSFLGIRQENQQTYEGDLEWRKMLGGIFPISNFSLCDNNRYARLLSARERDDLLSTKPCFAAMTTDEGDPELTKDVEMFVQGRVDQSNIIKTDREAIKVANIINEAVVKTTYVRDSTRYWGPATVLVDQTGQPIVTKLGLYVYQQDDFLPSPDTQNLGVLKKDPSFQMFPGQFQYARIPRLLQEDVKYDNVYAEVIDSRDFLCPLKVRRTEDADINVHLYEQTPEWLAKQYPNIDVSTSYFQRRRGAMTGQQQPRRASGEDDDQASMVIDRMLIAETYIRCDADEDGVEEEIMLVLDLTNEMPVFYDYLANHMGSRPFSVIPGVERVPNRWHAIGVFSKMRNPALYVDAQVNRINEKDSQNASITFFHEDASEAWRSGVPFAPGSRTPIKVRAGWDPHVPICGRINLQADAQLGMELLNLRRQASDLEFAVMSGRDASASELNQSKTATGVMSIERDANVISKDTEYDIVEGLVHQLSITTDLLLENMKPAEMMFRKGGQTLVTLNRDEIRALPRKVQLLLTKTRSAEMLATNEKAEAIAIRYYNLTPWLQFKLRDFYIKQLKGLEIDDADDMLEEVTKEQAQQWQADQAKKQNPMPMPSESIAWKYSDLARSEQVQLLQKAGITPASDLEMQQKQSSEITAKALEKGNAPDGSPVLTPGSQPGRPGPDRAAA